MSDELKPVNCGCGGEAEVHAMRHELTKAQYYINCEKCDTRTWFFDSESEAIETWNKAMGAKEQAVPNMTILKRKVDLQSILQAIKTDKIRVWLNYDGKICFQNTKTGNEISVEPYYDMEGNTNNE